MIDSRKAATLLVVSLHLHLATSRRSVRFLFFPTAAVALISQLVVLWAVLAGRAPASSSRRIARWAEVTWVVLPTVALLALLWATWRAVDHIVLVRDILGNPV